jgi:hypothetical protein
MPWITPDYYHHEPPFLATAVRQPRPRPPVSPQTDTQPDPSQHSTWLKRLRELIAPTHQSTAR